MFKKTESDQPLTDPTKINQDTSVEGEIVSKNNIRLDGSFTGKMTTQKKIVIGKTGFFSGKIICKNLVVEGVIKGEATVSNSTNLFENSSFNGILSTKKIGVEEGAIFDGNCITLEESKAPDLIRGAKMKEESQSFKATPKNPDSIIPKELEAEEVDENSTEN